MSLRGFHFVFITASILLAFGFAYYEWLAYREGNAVGDLVISAIAAAVGLSLTVYEIWFFKKSRKLKL